MASLRWRLVVIMLLADILVSLATGIANYRSQYASLQSELQTRARSNASILAAGAVATLRNGNQGSVQTLQDLVSSVKQAKGIGYAAVIAGNGCYVASTRASDRGK